MPRSRPFSISSSFQYEPIPDQSVEIEAKTSRLLWIHGAMSDISKLAPIIIVVTLAISSLFFKFYHGWEYSTSLYFAVQALVGVMYGEPEEDDRISQSVTLFLYFLGATYIYAAIAAYANLVAERTVKSARDIVHMEQVEDLDNDGIIVPRDWVVYFCNRFFNALDWNNHK
jgi:hypothetical protein